jgi:hypothetical protein
MSKFVSMATAATEDAMNLYLNKGDVSQPEL